MRHYLNFKHLRIWVSSECGDALWKLSRHNMSCRITTGRQTLTALMVFLCVYMALYLNLQLAVIWTSKHLRFSVRASRECAWRPLNREKTQANCELLSRLQIAIQYCAHQNNERGTELRLLSFKIKRRLRTRCSEVEEQQEGILTSSREKLSHF